MHDHDDTTWCHWVGKRMHVLVSYEHQLRLNMVGQKRPRKHKIAAHN